jgi:hypothetical protein
MRRRLLRYSLIGLVLLLLGGLWGFSFFFFNPFEGGYEYPIASLVPREVDFYAAKNELSRDFDPFPRLAFQDEFERSPAGKAVLELGVRDVVAGWKIDATLAELDAVLAQLPVRVDPLGIFGGKALAVAGHLAGPDPANARWAVYGRTSWIGKLAVELVAGGWIDLTEQGLTVKAFEQEGKTIGVEIGGGRLQRPIFLARIQDVVIVSTEGALLAAAEALEATRGQDSLDRSAKYTDNIVRTARPGDELELYLDQRALAENLGLGGTWPNSRSNDLATALVARLFQLGALRELIGTLDFAEVVSLDLVGELSSNVLSPFQTRLYDERGFDRDQMLEAARFATADSGLFVYLHADIGDLLRELRSVFLGIDPAAISNLEDFVRSAWNSDLDALIDDVDGALRDRAAFFVRDYDYPEEVGGNVPPHDDTPVFAWALVVWVQDQAQVDAIRGVVEREDVRSMLRLQGATPGSSGLWENTLQGGAKVKEYWNVLVPGTGQIATLEMTGREQVLVVSNENRLLGQIFKAYTTGRTDEGLTRLAEEGVFKNWVTSGLASANCLAWFAPRAIASTTRRIAARAASQGGADTIDWSVERPRIERDVLARNFPDETWGNVSAENRDAYETLVQQEVDRFQASYLDRHLPELQAESERWIRAWSALRCSFFQIATDRKRLQLKGRVALGFAEQGAEP